MNTTAVLLLRELRNRRDLWRSAMRDIREATARATIAQSNAKTHVAAITDIEQSLVTLGITVPKDAPTEADQMVTAADGKTAEAWVAAPTSREYANAP